MTDKPPHKTAKPRHWLNVVVDWLVILALIGLVFAAVWMMQ